MTIYIIGHLAIDEVIIDKKEFPISMGGTANFASIACSRLAYPEPVMLISKIGPDFPDEFLTELEEFNINTDYVFRVKRHSTRYVLNYIDDKRELTLKSVCTPITTEDIPVEISEAKLIYFGPIANEISAETIIYIKERSDALLAVDIQGLIRHRDSKGKLFFRSSSKIDELLSYFDVVKLDIGEAQTITGVSKMRDITSYLTNIGVKSFILTKSRKGAVLFFEGKLLKIPAIILKRIYNTTGAGDCFFSSYLVEYLKTEDPFHSIRFAVKAVSYLIGSPDGIKSFTVKGDIYKLIDDFISENQVK